VAAEIAGGWAPILKGIELRSGNKGVFKVSLDNDLVFDKARAGHFPQPGDIAELARARLGEQIPWRKSERE
jgi:predicted Rdx family selenoprotein